jgi:xanthosine utilization system XapX-like protein/plasmid maintenance system killer protein
LELETQLAKLAELGLALNAGIEIEDLLYSLDRSKLEADPLMPLIGLLGVEVERAPWGRRICDRVWNFDTECINSTGDYVKIVQKLGLLTGTPDYLTEIVDEVKEDAAWLEYTIEGRKQHWSIELNDDWADMIALSYVMEDLQRDGKQFYSIDNGQAMILFYFDPETATKLGDLCNEDLEPVIPA